MKDRFMVHAMLRNRDHAEALAVAFNALTEPTEKVGWNGVGRNIYDVFGVLDGADLQLFTSMVANNRESLVILEINRAILEGTL